MDSWPEWQFDSTDRPTDHRPNWTTSPACFARPIESAAYDGTYRSALISATFRPRRDRSRTLCSGRQQVQCTARDQPWLLSEYSIIKQVKDGYINDKLYLLWLDRVSNLHPLVDVLGEAWRLDESTWALNHVHLTVLDDHLREKKGEIEFRIKEDYK